MDEEEDEVAGEVEEGVNPPHLPPIIRGNLLNSFDSAGDNNGGGGVNSSLLSNEDEDRPRPSAADASATAAMPSSRACGGSEKRKAGDGANPRKSRTFSKPLKLQGSHRWVIARTVMTTKIFHLGK
jgi:hypothetical protein